MMFVKIFILTLFFGLLITDSYAKKMPEEKKKSTNTSSLIYLDTSANNPLYKESSIMILLDASGSMSGSKIDSAKKTILTIMGELKSTKASVGLMAFNSECAPAKLLIDSSNTNLSKVKNTIEAIQAGGSTPLAVSIREAGMVIDRSGKKTRLIVISDGGESCGGNPFAEAQKLHNTIIDVIGFGVDSATQGDLSKIVTKGEGKYYSANDQDTLIISINAILGRDFTVDGITRDGKKNIVTDTRRKLMWQDVSKKANWQDAIKECTYSDYAGYTDWRLPKIEEISALPEIKHYDLFFKHAKITDWSSYWSSSRNMSDYPIQDYAWGAVVYIQRYTDGTTSVEKERLFEKTRSLGIQCVRDIR